MCSLYRKRQTVNLEVHLKFKTKKGLGITVALATTFMFLSSVAVAQDAKTVIANATKAMGYDKLNTIQYSGSGFEGTGAGFLDWVWPVHETFERTSHQVTNILIEVDGDRATSETYVTVCLRGAEADIVGRGRYHDTWSRRDGRWGVDVRRYRDDIQQVVPR